MRRTVTVGFICIVIMIAFSTLCIVDAINDLTDAIENSPAVIINNTSTINNN